MVVVDSTGFAQDLRGRLRAGFHRSFVSRVEAFDFEFGHFCGVGRAFTPACTILSMSECYAQLKGVSLRPWTDGPLAAIRFEEAAGFGAEASDAHGSIGLEEGVNGIPVDVTLLRSQLEVPG